MKMVLVLVVAAVLFSVLTAACANEEGPTISPEDAVEIAARRLPEAVVARSDIKVELHGWYWEVVFDGINAPCSELSPIPRRFPSQPIPESDERICQSVVIPVDAETGDTLGYLLYEAPRPGPYVSQEQAIASAQEWLADLTLTDRTWRLSDRTWLDDATVEAYLRGDIWVVLFYEAETTTEDGELPSVPRRITVWVRAVTGHAYGGHLP